MSIDLSTYKKTTSNGSTSNIKLNFTPFAKTFSDKKKEAFYRELSMLLRAGVDFKKALEILVQQSSSKVEQDLFGQLKEKITHGKSIYEAMMTSEYFSQYEYFSVQIGEETRKLEDVLDELQKFFSRKIQMRRQVISVLTYPAIVMLVTLAVLYFMLNKVVPMFSSVFRQFGSELPASTRMIIKLSNYSGTIFLLFFLFMCVALSGHALLKSKNAYRDINSKIILKIPYFGGLIRKIYLSRFCQAMGLLLSAKTTLLTSLALTGRMIGFYPIEKSLEEVRADVTRGMSLSESLRKHGVYEKKMISMIEVAEQVNELDSMFDRLADQYNREIDHQTRIIGVVLEPLIIIFIGVIVGVIMISMYAPMFDLSKIIKN